MVKNGVREVARAISGRALCTLVKDFVFYTGVMGEKERLRPGDRHAVTYEDKGSGWVDTWQSLEEVREKQETN